LAALPESVRARAVALIIGGLTYQQVADELGYASRGASPGSSTRRWLTTTSEAVEALQEVEVACLDALQASLWDLAMHGDIAAAQAVLRFVQRWTGGPSVVAASR
jgi:hypothetical protein